MRRRVRYCCPPIPPSPPTPPSTSQQARNDHAGTDDRLCDTESGIDASRGSFDKTVSGARWLCTSGLRWFLPFWYSREPIFWLPHGWFPYYAEWLISFPRAPLGSVSVASWQLACAGVVALLADTIGAIVRLVVDARQKAQAEAQQARRKEEPVRASAAQPEEDEKTESKKEL